MEIFTIHFSLIFRFIGISREGGTLFFIEWAFPIHPDSIHTVLLLPISSYLHILDKIIQIENYLEPNILLLLLSR